MKVFFGTSVIQKSRRVALDPNLLQNLGLSEGDRVQVFLDTDTQSLIIKKDGSPSFDVSQNKPRKKT